MIKSIELENFESHKHTVIDDFSEGVNLLVGESNSGKTSIIRALRAVAYNEFDNGSVRVGTNHCTIKVTTDKGWVKLTRGPRVNVWETQKNGEPPRRFEKVGKNVVPEAAEIIGFKLVTLGNVEFPVNVMGQLESHFMLSGVGDKAATGSMRAQIVDEISGLSGIEFLIKDIAADSIRVTRERNETAERKSQIESEIVPESEIKAEEATLCNVGELLGESERQTGTADEAEVAANRVSEAASLVSDRVSRVKLLPDADLAAGLAEKSETEARKAGEMAEVSATSATVVGRIERNLAVEKSLPDIEAATDLIDNAEKYARAEVEITGFRTGAKSVQGSLVAASRSFKSLPDTSRAAELLSEAENCNTMAAAMDSVCESGRAVRKRIAETEKRETALPQTEVADELLAAAGENAAFVSRASEYVEKIRNAEAIIELRRREFSDATRRHADAEKELTELISSVKVCPFTNFPLSESCRAAAAKTA